MIAVPVLLATQSEQSTARDPSSASNRVNEMECLPRDAITRQRTDALFDEQVHGCCHDLQSLSRSLSVHSLPRVPRKSTGGPRSLQPARPYRSANQIA